MNITELTEGLEAILSNENAVLDPKDAGNLASVLASKLEPLLTLATFGEGVLQTLEEEPEWGSGTFDCINESAYNLGLVNKATDFFARSAEATFSFS